MPEPEGVRAATAGVVGEGEAFGEGGSGSAGARAFGCFFLARPDIAPAAFGEEAGRTRAGRRKGQRAPFACSLCGVSGLLLLLRVAKAQASRPPLEPGARGLRSRSSFSFFVSYTLSSSYGLRARPTCYPAPPPMD